MTGRGRVRKAKSPETNCVRSKASLVLTEQKSLPRCPVEDVLEEKHNGTIKERKLEETRQKTVNTKEKPCVQSTRKETTTKHYKETKKPQRTSKDTSEAPVQGTKGKAFAGKAKVRGEPREETTKMKLETTKDMTKDSLKSTRGKSCGARAKAPAEFTEKLKMQSDTPMDTTKVSIKTTTAKTSGGKTESVVETTTTKTQQDPTNTSMKSKNAKACAVETRLPVKFTEDTTTSVAKDIDKDSAAVNTILKKTLEKLKIKMTDKANAAEVVNDMIKQIIKHLKQNSECFKEVEEPLRTGSYYENVKISEPNEFDVMLPFPVDRAKVEPFGDDGAFYSVVLKRENGPLHKFQGDTLSASKMLEEFSKEVNKCVKLFPEWKVTRKKKGCPAVTLTTTVQSVTISLDVVLCLMVKSSWPPFTNEGLKINHWLGTKVKQDFKRNPYYLVPKYEGRGTVKKDGVLVKDVWRVSFSHIEKAILMNHGSEKTCCEKNGDRCCRKDCLKLLKHLLSLLKENNSSFDKFCSYHAKTMLLHACCSRTKDSDWRASSLSQCFQLLLEDFVGHLEKGQLHNFFIPSQNLLSGADQRRCNVLAGLIREESEKHFPIFQMTTS